MEGNWRKNRAKVPSFFFPKKFNFLIRGETPDIGDSEAASALPPPPLSPDFA
jgi:hypothetical protein